MSGCSAEVWHVSSGNGLHNDAWMSCSLAGNADLNVMEGYQALGFTGTF